ncbi:hypothetical protein [Subtercola endophyticus]|uniref:hypothetical protein n=1 Tax=Subtercola endophyticus TaxID=2895559 RepID=UPI001E5E7723|nr:hypothetical protein [Subtercola endophyticus]UFS60183.1 hypothetical protein LQ955_05335 [Subtercola endophyticus]
MASSAHNSDAQARDDEVAGLRPGVERKHLRTTLPARVVLRGIGREHNSEDGEYEEPEVRLIGESYVVAVVDGGTIDIYAGASPVHHTASIPTDRVVGVETARNFDYTPPRINPTLRLKLAEEGTEPLDLDLEIFDLEGGELQQKTDITADVAWWVSATGSPSAGTE